MKEEKGSLKADPEATDEGRRRLLQRLGLGAAVATLAYTSPLLLDLSEASASRGSRGSRRSRGSRGFCENVWRMLPNRSQTSTAFCPSLTPATCA